MVSAFLIVVALSAPYEDPLGRYEIDPPKGWKLVRSQSTEGTPVFRYKKRGKTASVKVQVSLVPDGIGLEGAERKQLDAIKSIESAAILEEAPVNIGGFRARSIRYSVKTGRRRGAQTFSEVWLTQLYNRAYALTFTAKKKKQLVRANDQLRAFAQAFTPMKEKKALENGESPLIGRWVNVRNPNSVLVLGVDGSLQIDDAQGSFAVSSDTIVTLLDDGGQVVYRWNVKGKKLVLRSDRGRTLYRRAN